MTRLPPHWWTTTVSTQRRSVTQDASGSVLLNYTGSYLTGQLARIVEESAKENSEPNRINTVKLTTVYVDGAPDILETDRIIWTDPSSAQHVYDIQAVVNPDKLGVYTICSCLEVKP